MTDPAADLQAMRDGMTAKAVQLWNLTSKTDQHGRRQQVTPAPPTQHTYEAVSPEQRIETIDRLLPDAQESEQSALLELREQAVAEANPGGGDGGARETLPAPSLQERADQAVANGDLAGSMSIKSQMLGGIIQRRNEGN